LDWKAESGPCRLYAVSQKPAARVKRAAPGGAGFMLNPLYPPAIRKYLERFEDAFNGYSGLKPRAIYHDSFEYQANWAPDLFAAFERRRGYKLQSELPALFGDEQSERAARVKSDYRETLSDLLVEDFTPTWVAWSRKHGFNTRNQAPGSPGSVSKLPDFQDRILTNAASPSRPSVSASTTSPPVIQIRPLNGPLVIRNTTELCARHSSCKISTRRD
jgi:hypothetical protein